MSTDPKSRAWMEIRASALRRNLERVRSAVAPGVGLIPMVKADAYGVGLGEAVSAFEPVGPWAYGVAAVEEGLALRALGVDRPILVLVPLPPGSEEAAIEAGLTISISSEEALMRLRRATERTGRQADFHVEIDTGMGRAGFDGRDVGRWSRCLAEPGPLVRWTGCFTHLHSADEDPDSVHGQWRRFREALSRMPTPASDFRIHVLNSSGAFRCPEYAADAVRPGIFLYGGGAGSGLERPAAVAAVRARVVHVRDAPAGTTLGYSSTYRSGGAERWATVGLGYGDGLPRSLGNRGSALVRGRRVPIVGRISMDVSVVDITGVDTVEPGEVVTFLGVDGSEEILVDELAEAAGTISYEILTGFTARVRRVRVDEPSGR